MIRDFFDDNWYLSRILTVILVSIIISIFVCIAIIKWNSQFYIEKEPVITQVDDKDRTTTMVPHRSGNITTYTQTHSYYIISDGYRMNVSSSIYNDLEIGDKIVVYQITKYYKEDNSIYTVYYEYAGE